jgi:DNA modification methylase
MWCLQLFSREGDTILDPFMGSCTTGVACALLKRNFIGIERDKEYYDMARKRVLLAEQGVL